MSDAARLAALRFITSGCTLRLFTNDATPAADSTPADFIPLPSGGGYAPYKIPDREWAVDDFEASVTHTWNVRGFQAEVYGWVVEKDGYVVTAGRYDAGRRVKGPESVTVSGGRLEVTAVLAV